ncbi:MAG: hypothetical protein FWG41_04695 [Methanomassiliicoccaceae archaeon]|nr:hypothetical protein [Methanomassiliicoccaceae archaeon]
METVPRIVKIGCALGFIGGIICMIGLALFFEVEDSALANMGAYMLIAVMFFALAGGFAKGGQWSWNVLLLMTFLTIAAVGCSVIFEVLDVNVGIILVAVGALIVASLSMPSSKTWTNRMRF